MDTFITKLDKKRNLTTFAHYDFPFYLLLIYLFFEYGRPQSFFPVIGALHPGYILHTLLFLCLFLKGKLLNFKNIQTRCFLGLLLLTTLHGPIAVNNYYAYLIWRGTLLYFIVYLSIVNFVDSFEKIEKIYRYMDNHQSILCLCRHKTWR